MDETTETTTSGDEQHPVKILKHRKNLKCRLTEHQIVERAQRSAYLDGDIEQKREAMEAALNRAKADAKLAESKIEELESERRRLSLEVREGSTYADVDCQTRFIYRTGTVVEVRMDTKPETVIDERPMTDRERQLELPEGAKKPEDASNGSGGAALTDPDKDDMVVDDDYTEGGEGDTDDDDDDDDSEDEDSDDDSDDDETDEEHLERAQRESGAGVGSDGEPPKLATQKRQTGGKGGGGKGGGGKGKAGKGGKGKR